jgi:hypothetical protein
MEVSVVGHDEAGGEDDHYQDQQVEAQEHLLHPWSRKDTSVKETVPLITVPSPFLNAMICKY